MAGMLSRTVCRNRAYASPRPAHPRDNPFLSGLFTLWQWMIDDTFRNIICLSGSFWYEGFVGWIRSFEIPRKTGKAYFFSAIKKLKPQ